MFAKLAKLVSQKPLWVLAVWLLVFALSFPFAGRVGEVLTAQPDTLAGSAATQVNELLSQNFEGQSEQTLILVTYPATGSVRDSAFQEAYAALIDTLEPFVTSVQDYRASSGLPLTPEDGRFTVSLLGLSGQDRNEARDLTLDVIDALEQSGIDYTLSGGPASQLELEDISKRDAERAELFGLPLSLIVLLIAFGALVASSLPLLVASVTISLSFAILFGLGQVMAFAVFTQSIVTMLGLATGIDYALLMVNRFREELKKQDDPNLAAEKTALSAGRAVTFSGLTVLIALAALLIPPLDFIRSIGVGTIVVLLVSVTVSITALPACLALLGHRVNWLKVTRQEPGQRSRAFWARQAERITARPGRLSLGILLLLVVMSLPATTIQLADSGTRGLSETTDIRRGFVALERLGLEGLTKSFDVLIDFGERGFFHPSSLRDVSQLTRALQSSEDVGGVYSAFSPEGLPRLLLYQYYASQELALESDLADLVRATVSRDGRYALLRAFPNAALSPNEAQALSRDIQTFAQDNDLRLQVGGGYIAEREWTRILYNSFPLAVALVYLATFISLGLAFHSLLIPLKAILLNTLTVGAAFGVVTLVFQYGWGARLIGLSEPLGFVDNSVPIFIFAIVFGLSMDYEVFLMARIFEAHQRGLHDREAVIQALSATGGVITSAAAIMLVVFSIFIFSEVALIKILGLGLAVAIFLDATLVRAVLVPALMQLAGRWNWWLPKPIARLSERIDLGHD